MHHPSQVVESSTLEEIRSHAREAENLKTLHPRQLRMIREHQWFKMYIPKTLGGRQLPLPEIVRILEALSWADGSTAWVVTLCSGAGWFNGFIDPALGEEFFLPSDVCIAGSGAVTGRADDAGDHLILSGEWANASGANHASAFTFNCQLYYANKPVSLADGSPVVQSFILKKEEVTLQKTWRAMGMIATGSHSFSVNAKPVGRERMFHIHPDFTTHNSSVFKYPFQQLAESTLAVNLSGMAFRFVELAGEQFKRKNFSPEAIRESAETLDAARDRFFQVLDESWAVLPALPSGTVEKVTSCSHELVRVSREVINRLFPVCGLAAANPDLEINRVFRNFYTAGQHSLFQFR